MVKNYYLTVLMLIVLLLLSTKMWAQADFINYQGVARDAENNLLEQEELTVGIGLRFGAANATLVYEETHMVETDANGVFSLKIGNGTVANGNFSNLPWGGTSYLTIFLNGVEIGTTELSAVPYALASGDKQWGKTGDVIENLNEGDVVVRQNFKVEGALNLSTGNQVNEISDNGTLSENSNGILPTQRAVKTYVDNKFFAGGGVEQTAVEVPYDNSASGLTAVNAQEAIDELAAGAGGADADADPTNELQNLTLTGTSLEISDGTGVDLSGIIPPGGTDDQTAAEVPFNNAGTGLVATDTQAALEELAAGGLVDTDDQDLSLTGTVLNITDGTGVDLSGIIPPGGTDNQDLILTGDVLTIEDGAGSVDLGNYVDVTGESGLLMGDGTNISGLEGTADGQVAKWDAGSGQWIAGTDEVGGGGGSSLWKENGSDIYFDSGSVGVGNSVPGVESGASTYLTVATGTSPGDNALASVEIQGGQGSTNQPIGRLDFISNSSPGNSAITRIETKTAGGAQFKGDLSFFTKDGAAYGSSTLQERLTIKYNGNIGVGVTNPTEKLDVEGTIKSRDLAGTGQRNVVADADGNLMIGSSGGRSSLWEENDSDIYFDTGNVGIGISNPETKMHIGGNLFLQSNLGNLILGYPGNGNQWRLGTLNGGGTLQFRYKEDGSNTLSTHFRMRKGGEFQFGDISNVSSWVHIRNNSTLLKPLFKLEETGNDFARLELTNDAVSDSFWHVAGLPSTTASDAKLNFYFRNASGAGNRMTITGDGRIGINTESPSARLTINQGGQSVGSGLSFSDNTENQDWHITHGFSLRFHYGGALRGFINANNGAYVQSSDKRLKSEIRPLTNVVEKVKELKPSTYYYKSDIERKRTIGLIAQDVQSIFPDLVSSDSEDELLGLNYSAFAIVAIKAIQEQQLLIEKQSEKIASLEARLLRLEKNISK
ncbi:tail fiber domain-containing protein [Cytophaga sp. FL35]|uniref:tail fiber domain-containing protein n=1 Tax=Cytophaga sp. FL35 TaxID=1904456 RepID=UPI0016535F91|nr:tail fiber domain-containing protein [Cytophaga sp. FL35]MBC6997391.1 tail fiber domain-containing protein [Cytophaga sp. FL35]